MITFFQVNQSLFKSWNRNTKTTDKLEWATFYRLFYQFFLAICHIIECIRGCDVLIIILFHFIYYYLFYFCLIDVYFRFTTHFSELIT